MPPKREKTVALSSGGKQALISSFFSQPISAVKKTPTVRKPTRQREPPPPDAEIISVGSDNEEPPRTGSNPAGSKREIEPPSEMAQPPSIAHDDTPYIAPVEEMEAEMSITAAHKRKAVPVNNNRPRKKLKSKRGGRPTVDDPWGDDDFSDYAGSPSSTPPKRDSSKSLTKSKLTRKRSKRSSDTSDEEGEGERETRVSPRKTRSTRQSAKLASSNRTTASSAAIGDSTVAEALQDETGWDQPPSASQPLHHDATTATNLATPTRRLTAPVISPYFAKALEPFITAPSSAPRRPSVRLPNTPERTNAVAGPSRLSGTPADTRDERIGRPSRAARPSTPNPSSPTRPRTKPPTKIWFLPSPPPPCSPPPVPAPPSSSLGLAAAVASSPLPPHSPPSFAGKDAEGGLPNISQDDARLVNPFVAQPIGAQVSSDEPSLPLIAFLPQDKEDEEGDMSDVESQEVEEEDELESSQDSLSLRGGAPLKRRRGVDVVDSQQTGGGSAAVAVSDALATGADDEQHQEEEAKQEDKEDDAKVQVEQAYVLDTPDQTSQLKTEPKTEDEEDCYTKALIATHLEAFRVELAKRGGPPPQAIVYDVNVKTGECHIEAVYRDCKVKKEEDVGDVGMEQYVEEEFKVKNEPLDEDQGLGTGLGEQEETLESQASMLSLLSLQSIREVGRILTTRADGEEEGLEESLVGEGVGPVLSPRRVSRTQRLQNTQ